MKRFENKVLLIESEEMAEELRNLFWNKYRHFIRLVKETHNYLFWNPYTKAFTNSYKQPTDTELTYEQFINLLNE